MKSEKPTPHPYDPVIGDGVVPTEDTSKHRGPRFLKLAPGERYNLICVSHVWTGAVTHFYGRRMHLHQATACPFCAAKREKRFYAWLHVCTEDFKKEFVVQLSSASRPLLSKHFDIHGTLRGSRIFVKRDGKNPNTPTTIEWRTPPEPIPGLPQPMDIKTTLLSLMDPSRTKQATEEDVEPDASRKEPDS